MATVCLLVKFQKYAVAGHQGQFSVFLLKVKEIVGTPCVKFQYADEDGDLITVDSQFDFQEALRYGSSGKPLILEPMQSSEDRFLEAIPIESSVMFSDQGSLQRDLPNQILVSEMVEESKSVSSETNPVEKAEKEVHAARVVTKEEASLAMVERGEAGTNMDQIAVSCETQPLETKDGSNLAPIVATATIASGPEPVSTACETAQIQILDQFASTDPMIHTSSATPPIEQHEISIQCDEFQPPPPVLVQPAPLQAFDPNIIKSLIQEEMKGLFPAKRSILRSRVSMNSVHQGYHCNLCGAEPIRGARFTCTQCGNFNLCEDCEDTNEHEHVLLKFRLPQPPPQALPAMPHKPEEAKKAPIPPSMPIPELLNEKNIRYPSLGPPKKDLSAVEAAQKVNIEAIMEMGFTREQAINALIGNGHNLDAAINALLG